MSAPKRYLITSALPYANGPLHIGHIAGAYLTADVYARHLRLSGKEVAFICGSDEHGAAITLRAKKEGGTPQEIVDKYHEINKKAFADLGISFDMYHRTSSELHHKTAQDFFTKLEADGAFTKQTSEQFYDAEYDQFLADRYVSGTCPNCSHDAAYGDQCEKCGTSLSPKELINPKSTLSGKTPELKTTSHWYLPMDQHEEWLRDWIENGKLDGAQHHDPAEWKNQVVGQCKSWIDGGLQPRAMTRDLDWGVKVPVEGGDGKVLYVWLDAPIGYISATKEWAGDDWEKWWKDEDTRLLHFIGKDNIVFHCIIFPILLKAHGEFNLPNNVPANEFLNLQGDKLSTSRNWAVWLHEYLEDMPNREDELRYVLASILPENRDSEFTWEDYRERVNSELVGVLGNFVNRALVLTHKNFDGQVPAGTFEPELHDAIGQCYDNLGEHLEAYRFRQALSSAMEAARIGNKYLADTEPWKLLKEFRNSGDEAARAKAGHQLYNALTIAGHCSMLLEPFLPHACARLREMLNFPAGDVSWNTSVDFIAEGHMLNPASLLFQKVEEEEIEAQIAKLGTKDGAPANDFEPVKDTITFDDFTKLDIRVATILEAEKHPKADRLLVLKVDTGVDHRTIVSGIAEHYAPEDVVGKTVTVLLNLAPRKLRGIESQGMILMAEDGEGKLSFMAPADAMSAGWSVS